MGLKAIAISHGFWFPRHSWRLSEVTASDVFRSQQIILSLTYPRQMSNERDELPIFNIRLYQLTELFIVTLAVFVGC